MKYTPMNITQQQKPWVSVYKTNKHNKITNQSLYEYFSK